MTQWLYNKSMEQGFYSVMARGGRIIALRIPDEPTASQICQEHDDYQKCLEMLDKAGVWTGADNSLSDRLAYLLAEKGMEKC